MRQMTKKIKAAVQLSRVLPYEVFGFRIYNVEAVRVQNYVTDGVFLFGKCVWVEKDLTHAHKMFD